MLALLITGNQSPGNAPAQGNDMNTSVELSVNGKRTQTKQDAPGFARRSFIKRLAIGGASILPLGIALADSNGSSDGQGKKLTGSISKNDAAILRFLAAAEIIETDLWQQYNELAGPDGPYRDALDGRPGKGFLAEREHRLGVRVRRAPSPLLFRLVRDRGPREARARPRPWTNSHRRNAGIGISARPPGPTARSVLRQSPTNPSGARRPSFAAGWTTSSTRISNTKNRSRLTKAPRTT